MSSFKVLTIDPLQYVNLQAEMTKLRQQREYKQFLELQVEQQKDQNAKTKSAFANRVSDAYFDQFERSHR